VSRRSVVPLLLALAVLLGSARSDGAPWGARPPVSPPFLLARFELAGDRLIDADDAFRGLPWRAGERIPVRVPGEVAGLLESRLVRAGWWAADVAWSVGPETERGRVVTFVLSAGEPVVVGEVGVRGSRHLSEEEILARVDLKPGQPFDEGTFRADVDRVLRGYSERGYPLARIYPSRFRRTDDGRLGYDLRVSEGPAGEIETVRVFGNRHTEGAVVARIAGVRPGDRWDPRRIESMAPRLRRESLFSEVGEPRIVKGSRDDRLGVEIEVEEGPSNSIFGVLGYNPKPGGGGGEVVGLVDLNLRNLLGTARRAAFRFERQASDVQDLAFRYREPWVLGSPVSLEVGAAQARRDTLYSRTDLDLTVAFPIRARSTGRIAAERRDTSFDISNGMRETETSTGGSVALEVEARDRRVNPGRGWRAQTLVGLRRTRDDVSRTRTENDAQVLVPFGRRWVLSEEAAFRGVWSSGDDVPLYEQYFLGGTNTVRGYREEQFHGASVWWARTELRLLMARRSRAYLLADVGGYSFEERTMDSSRTVDDVVFGGGVGISVETSASGIVRFELALGRGDAFSDAKVHVGLEQEF
jgi:outer membrane protein insertion porin family